LQKLKVAKIESCQILKFPILKVAKVENEFLSCQIAKLANCQVAKLPSCKIAKLPSCKLLNCGTCDHGAKSLSFLLRLGGVHKLCLQEEVDRWLSKCQQIVNRGR
jgi:hypothetical protein